MVFEKIREIIIEQLQVDESEVTMDTNLMKDLSADSLDAVEIIMAMEDEYLSLIHISVMMDFLGRLTFVNEDQNDFIEFYNKYIGFCLKGENLGIDFRDDISGNLVFNVGMAEIDGEMGSLTINIRYPVSGSAQQVYDAMEPVLSDYNIGLVKAEDKEPIYIDADSPIVKTLMSVYRENTGDEKSQPLVIGGGTYARATPGVIAFGALFPGDEDLMHQKDECISLERLDLMTKIYTEAIYKLASEDYNI